jgi:amidase
MSELISRPLVEIARALRDKQATAQELAEQAIARHDRFGERLHAYCLWTPERARAVALAADSAFAAERALGTPAERLGTPPMLAG